MSKIIELKNVNKWFDKFQALKDVNLEVNQQEKIVICGPSGSGKSTLIRCINRLEEHQKGSIIVDGTELTEETKSKTFLGSEQEKSTVNLERAASFNKRIGGHLLEGHIEGTAVCKKINILKNSNEVIFETDKKIIDNIVEKGYIGIDGTSITIVSIDNNQFAISLIPLTMDITTLGHLSKNQIVNIETDINARYIRKYVEQIMKK